MVKTYCDICGSEILKHEKEFRLECLELIKDSQQYDYDYKGENVCEDCIHDINNFIANHLRTYTIKSIPIYNEKAVYSYEDTDSIKRGD